MNLASAEASMDCSELKTSKRINSSWLHVAARVGDLPPAYECIRMGFDLDSKDSTGATPLQVALETLQASFRVRESVGQRRRTPIDTRSVPDTYSDDDDNLMSDSRVARVATLLIEQYANIHITKGQRTLLHLACQIARWPLIELLLLHGATPRPAGIDLLAEFAHSSQKSQ